MIRVLLMMIQSKLLRKINKNFIEKFKKIIFKGIGVLLMQYFKMGMKKAIAKMVILKIQVILI